MIQEIFKKISSYNIFNYLLPGILFASIAQKISTYEFIISDPIVDAFLYYFAGMVISRLGSIILEPLLKWIKFLKYSEYTDYIAASKKDEKIEILLEASNTYRTICSVFIGLGILKLYEFIGCKYSFWANYDHIILILSLFLLFLFSYKKQTKYIYKRVMKVVGNE